MKRLSLNLIIVNFHETPFIYFNFRRFFEFHKVSLRRRIFSLKASSRDIIIWNRLIRDQLELKISVNRKFLKRIYSASSNLLHFHKSMNEWVSEGFYFVNPDFEQYLLSWICLWLFRRVQDAARLENELFDNGQTIMVSSFWYSWPEDKETIS